MSLEVYFQGLAIGKSSVTVLTDVRSQLSVGYQMCLGEKQYKNVQAKSGLPAAPHDYKEAPMSYL